MRCRTKITLALPLAILLLGVALPLAVRRESGPDPRPPAPEARRAGRTAPEWRELAVAALERGHHNLALRRIKTAEAVRPGRQYADETRRIREAARDARDVARARRRLLEGGIEHIEFDHTGAVLIAYRSAVVLPGESLWSIARSMASADEGVPEPSLAAGDSRVYPLWDSLTGLNGLRELRVGERIRIPLPAREREAIASANARDLADIAEGTRALERGDVEAATALLRAVDGAFARTTPAWAAFDEAFTAARRAALIEEARAALSEALALPRATEHAAFVRALTSARGALVEAARLEGASGHVEGTARIDTLLAEAARYRTLADGSVVAVKPAGVAYTDAVRTAVEWFLDRKLEASGAEFPYYDRKTDDEIGWARYLYAAAGMAKEECIDFAALLESGDAREVRLPNPRDYFDE
jgi:hypothetical protein